MKIKHANLNKIINKCTGKEIDFILDIAQYQDEQGNIKGIDYKTICKNINICKSTFFKFLLELQKKEIIEINYLEQEYSFWDVKIIDNDFSDEESYKEGYLNINNDFLHSKEFLKLTKGEKIIVLNLFKIAHNRHSIKITINTLLKWTERCQQSIKKYIQVLSKYFNIERKNNLFIFNINAHFFRKSDSEKDIRNKHIINYLLKKTKTSEEPGATKEVSKLFNQYSKIDPNIIFDIIEKSLKSIGILNVKYVHKYLSNYLNYTKLQY